MTAGPWVVLDTNVVLDLMVFRDPATASLLQAVQQQQVGWLVCAPMVEELERVLHYPKLNQALQQRALTPAGVMQAGFALWQMAPAMAWPGHRVRCDDPDDQVFLDLAVQYQAVLLSKDQAILRQAKPLARHGVVARPHW
ncbi:MAG: hypothetical protein RLZZ401_2212 [Pseudomonadota bacterium]